MQHWKCVCVCVLCVLCVHVCVLFVQAADPLCHPGSLAPAAAAAAAAPLCRGTRADSSNIYMEKQNLKEQQTAKKWQEGKERKARRKTETEVKGKN